MTTHGSDGKRNKRRRRVVALVLGLAFALLCGEGALRFLLFSDSALAQRLGQSWRREGLYTDSADADWWKLQWIFHREMVTKPPTPDPVVGWTGPVTAGTYEPPSDEELGSRTPVLLYGDSNAQCLTSPQECFQGLMAGSDLSDRYVLYNFGVGGYGLDQIQRLISVSVDRFADKKPIVIVSFLVDDDLERCLTDFRCWPKPRYELKEGALVDPPPVDTEPERFLEHNPPQITSYLWRLLRGTWRPFDWAAAPTSRDLEERRALNRAILERIRSDLDSRSLSWFMLLFQMDGSMSGSPTARWSQGVVDEFVAAHDVPCIRTKDFFVAVNGPDEPGLGDLIGRDPILMDHLNDAGNKLVFEAIRQGLEGRFEHIDLERVRKLAAEGVFTPDLRQMRELTVLGCSARFEGRTRGTAVRYRAPTPGGPPPRLSMRAGDDGHSQMAIDLFSLRKRMSARVRAVSTGQPKCAGEMQLSARTDDGEWVSKDFTIGENPREWTVDTRGARLLELKVVYSGPNPACAWLTLENLQLD